MSTFIFPTKTRLNGFAVDVLSRGKKRSQRTEINKSSAVMQDMDTDNGSSTVSWKKKK